MTFIMRKRFLIDFVSRTLCVCVVQYIYATAIFCHLQVLLMREDRIYYIYNFRLKGRLVCLIINIFYFLQFEAKKKIVISQLFKAFYLLL